MKKRSLLLLLATALALSCDNERNLPVTPTIKFNRVEFKERTNQSDPDALVLYIDFVDGDGDLGLSGTQSEPPFHQANYFLDNNGKLLTIRSRSNPAHAHLPPYESPFDCTNYTDPAQTLYFLPEVLDNTFNIVDTVIIDGITYLGVQDIIYFERNDDHYNIDVDFLVQNNDGEFEEFDWRTNFCNQSFDGRFPPLGDGDMALDGTLKYTMTSIGFKQLFSIKVLKLRVKIKDRALHESNTIETPEFTL